MDDKGLIKLCIVTTIIGVILLVVISDKIPIKTSVISSLKEKDINKVVKITGEIEKAVNKEKVSFIELNDRTGTINIVIFKPNNLTLKKGSYIEVEGKLNIYEDKLQVYAETVKIFS